jgi:soluble lytic murein transglycosylase
LRSLPLQLLLMMAFLCTVHSGGSLAKSPPKPPGTDPARQSREGGVILSAQDIRIWRQAFALAERGLHSAAALSTSIATDRQLAPVLTWMRLRDRDVMDSAEDYDRFMRDYSGFPSLSTVRARREAALFENADAAGLRAAFAQSLPVTADGSARWAILLKADGQRKRAIDLARQTWRDRNLDRDVEKELYDAFRRDLTADDHSARLDRLLWANSLSASRRMKSRVGRDLWKLADARMRLRGRSAGVDAAVSAVPAKLQNDHGLLYERIRFRRRTGQSEGAQDLLLASGAIGGDHRKIWIERRIQVRNLIKEGEYGKAYRIAHDHGVPSGAAFAQAEFEAGWLALRFLNRPKQALAHFQTLFNNVSYPVSLSRGAYWTARAYAVLGDDKAARAWFAEAAGHAFTYYGQLAAHELGQPNLILPTPPGPPKQASTTFNQSVLAGLPARLFDIGQHRLARLFLSHLIKTSERPDIYLLSSELARATGSPALLLTAGKLAALKRVMIADAAYPLAAEPGGQGHIASALAHAITRQESAFDQHAISHAGARGLMQLMPATARRVAAAENLAYSRSRLTGDPGYNTRLGGAYLADQIGRFDGYLPMAAGAYNAGPHRIDRWLGEYGDPRVGKVDPVDWVELIPFSETRNYVQRVTEALQVYRVRLSGRQRGASRLARDIGLSGTYLCGGRSGRSC